MHGLIVGDAPENFANRSLIFELVADHRLPAIYAAADYAPQVVAAVLARKVAVICTITNAVALSVKAATSDIPIVFAFGLDPVAMGLVRTFDRPQGNATGIYFPVTALDPKRLELLHELVPGERRFGVLVNPSNPNASAVTDLAANAKTFGLRLIVLDVHDAHELGLAFALMKSEGVSAVLVTSDPIFGAHREQLLDAANRSPLLLRTRGVNTLMRVACSATATI